MSRVFGPCGEITVDGSGAINLAPDLTYPANFASTTVGYLSNTGINATGGLTSALNLTGKYVIDFLLFENLTAENITIKLTIDGVVIWNTSFTCSTTCRLFGSRGAGSSTETISRMQCNSSFLLEIQTTADISVDLLYMARKIL